MMRCPRSSPTAKPSTGNPSTARRKPSGAGARLAAVTLTVFSLTVAGCDVEEADSDAPRLDAVDAVPDGDAGKELMVAALHDDEEIQLRFRFGTDDPSWYHQYLVFEDGEWVRYGDGSDGPDEHGLYEDRISVMWDDGSVEGFADQGGYVVIHPGVRTTATAVPPEEVEAHPYLGGVLGRSDVRKFIPESREPGVPREEMWRHVRPPEELEALREEGVFLDLWQWRAHRSNPVGHADNGYVLEFRHSSSGRSMFTDNDDPETGAPAMMFDPEATGRRALSFDSLVERRYGQDDHYYLAEDFAVPFDPEHEWREGDAIPQRLLREPAGSRGAVRAEGRHEDGAWRVRVTRSLESPDPLDSKSIEAGRTYHVAFAVHSGGVGARHHDVSMPLTFALEPGPAEIVALRVERDPDEVEDRELEWATVPLFDPGDPTR